jgi:hypothetical protein
MPGIRKKLSNAKTNEQENFLHYMAKLFDKTVFFNGDA